ncbi:hypothetical protein MSG28_014250 [Choristoneura fumiferana]|uniref:Uncharacterized protein n=1 Tax=Choristoneura fumiferana TaxID=7141 RepID=A0ACC0JGL6_CHOFU|nr:hypothetical protein MSG28_014250 [Choristoneura fumiferana]
MKFFLVFLSIAALAYSSPVPQEESVLKLVIGNFVNCMNSDLNLCLKEHALRATERLRTVRQLKIIEGVTILNNSPKEAKSLEPLSDDPIIKNKQVTERLWEKGTELLENSELELSYGGEDEESRALGDAEESRGKKKDIKKKMKMLMPILLLLKAKAAALVVLFLGIMALSLFKIAVILKIAFIAKIIALIKMLLAKKHSHDDHGWAPAPEEHGHGHGGWESQGWGRSRNEAADMAYAAYKKQ